MGYTGEQKREYQRAWAQQRRDAWLTAHGPCPCGSHENLEIDHIDPAKKSHPIIWTWSRARLDAELEKCQVLCRACHLKKSVAFRAAKLRHGTSTMYEDHGCRCDACRAYKSARNKKRYAQVIG